MRKTREPFRIVRANFRAYLVMNAITYGLVAVGMITALIFPELNADRVASLDEDGTAKQVGELMSNVGLFALTIFAINVFKVAVATVLLPSLIVPFAGLILFTYHAFTFGVTLAPTDATTAKILIPHSVTMLIEFQAYVLVLLAAYLIGRAWVRPASVGALNRRAGYLHGLRQAGWVCLPALALFVIGAVYEAVEIAYVIPWMVAG